MMQSATGAAPGRAGMASMCPALGTPEPGASSAPERGRAAGADLYDQYCKPKLAELLHYLKLDQRYASAVGCTLTTDDGREVLDFVGGFGAAVLGHNHPELKACLEAALHADVAVQAQVSVRAESGRLAARLSDLTPGDAEYFTCFTNSGTEGIEAALKHAYKIRFDAVTREFERVSRVLNDFYYASLDAEDALALPGGKTLIDFRDDLDEYNLAQFERFQDHPTVIAFKGAFHGKTASSLSITFNKSYREPFQGLSAIDAAFVDPDEPARIAEIVEERQCVFYYPVLDEAQVVLRPAAMTTVIALVLEPILGEGGIIPLPEATLEWLAERHGALGVPYVIDEIQTGCGRTGTFYAYEQTPLARIAPEYVVLSKALGGGLLKIGAALIRKDVYDHDFGLLHTSTFSEDDLSALVASRFIDLLLADRGAMLHRIRDLGQRLHERLLDIQREFPSIVKSVRGRGLMLGIEFTDLHDRAPFFRLSGKQGILSLLVASYLLEHHRIRVLAPLTTTLKGNPGKSRRSVLRIQPPALLAERDVDRLVDGLQEALRAIERNDEHCLVGHLVGASPSAEERASPHGHPDAWPIGDGRRRIDSRVGFIIHPTGAGQLVDYFFPSFRDHAVDESGLRAWWSGISRYLEPVHVKSAYVTSNDYVVEVNLVLVPYLPEDVTSPKPSRLRREMRDKIQDAVTVAKELGDEDIPVTMVGLGAFSSISTDNGLALNDYEVPITTGNAFTVGLTVRAIEAAAAARGMDWARASVAIVGASGNIGQAVARLLAPCVGRLVLVGSSREDSLARLELTKRWCVQEALASAGDPSAHDRLAPRGSGLIEREVLRLAAEARSGAGVLRDRDGVSAARSAASIARAIDARFIEAAVGFEPLAQVDVVVVATSSADARLIRPDMVRCGAIVCCTSMPSNLDPSFASVPGVLAFDGGLARLPEGSEVRFVGFPEGGVTFGCLAETILLGFDGRNHSFAKGVLEPSRVREAMTLADIHGMGIAPTTLGGHCAPGAAVSREVMPCSR